MLGSQRSAMY
ncbi:rCG47064 [Rattus norvegicus]|uniref:RCG47064 n=1 Tax=Rattus norvegicus TaxID=10116 RepID=A6KU35_RAT|nr:rCG47064 [Rattus norvegicus]